MPLPALALAMIPSAAKFVGGLFQAKRGRDILRNTPLPTYDIAPEFQNNIGVAKGVMNMGGMPAQQYQAAVQNMFRNANFGVQQLQGRRAATAGVGNMVQRLNDAGTNLSVADANMALQNRRIGAALLTRANNMMGMQRNQKQQWEKFNPYLRKLNEGQALVGSGLQNTFGALTDASTMFQYDRYFNGVQGGAKAAPQITQRGRYAGNNVANTLNGMDFLPG